jgi:hypothetical protein
MINSWRSHRPLPPFHVSVFPGEKSRFSCYHVRHYHFRIKGSFPSELDLHSIQSILRHHAISSTITRRTTSCPPSLVCSYTSIHGRVYPHTNLLIESLSIQKRDTPLDPGLLGCPNGGNAENYCDNDGCWLACNI